MNIENGKTYLIKHDRKGTFTMRVDGQDGTWINGEVVGGQSDAMLDYNIKIKGDPITIRASLISSAVEQL